jgi:hypothetical protein
MGGNKVLVLVRLSGMLKTGITTVLRPFGWLASQPLGRRTVVQICGSTL